MRTGRPPNKSQEDVAAVQRTALTLRSHGLSYREIGIQMGMQASSVYKHVAKAMKSIIKEPAEDVKALELDRLDQLLGAVWSKSLEGDVEAVNAALRIMERRTKYLGLDAPKVDTTINLYQSMSVDQMKARWKEVTGNDWTGETAHTMDGGEVMAEIGDVSELKQLESGEVAPENPHGTIEVGAEDS